MPGYISSHMPLSIDRCTAPADALDEKVYGARDLGLTNMLVEGFELGVLWDEYGLVGDVIVCIVIHDPFLFFLHPSIMM